jgi:hypothetical protein
MAERDELRQQLPAHVLGELPDDRAADVEAALRTDAQLAREAEELRAVLDAVADAEHDGLDAPVGPLDEALTARIADAVGRELAGDAGGGTPSVGADRAASTGESADAPTIISVSSAHLAAAPLGHGAPEPGSSRRGRRGPTGGDGRTDGSGVPTGDDTATPRIDRRAMRWSRIAIPAAAVLLAVVVVVGVWQGGSAAPGLGVSEDIVFEVAADDLEVDARLVPHTWGTEVFLTMTGTIDGEVYRVDLEDEGGEIVSAGTFIGDGDLEVVCILNGAVLREDAVAVVVTTDDGELVMRADLDDVDFRSV